MSHMGSSDLMHHRIVRRAEVLEVTGLSRATLYRLISDGRFPAPVKLAVNAVGWRESAIREWLESREVVGPGEAVEDAEPRRSAP